jgi:O-antigen/teichoic acid export membrane protein
MIFAASQWALLSVTAKLGSSELLGQYALAVAVAAPIAMLTHLNLRAVLVTDVRRQYPFGDYLTVRLASSAAGLAITLAAALLSAAAGRSMAAIVLVGVALGVDNVSDIYYGLMQRRERMEQVGKSMIARGTISAAVFAFALARTHDVSSAVFMLALARIAVLLCYDRPRGAAGERAGRSGVRAQLAIFRSALPLGIVLMLVSLTASVPRYAIEHYLGTRWLGIFAAVASFIAVGSTVANALGQAATPRLAAYFAEGDLPRFLGLALRLVGLAALLGGAGVLGAALLGKPALSLLFRPEYAEFSALLVAIMVAGALSYLAITLGYVVTSARSFDAQVPLLSVVAAASGAMSWLLVPAMGLAGAALAIALASCVQIGGQAVILRRAVRRREAAC